MGAVVGHLLAFVQVDNPATLMIAVGLSHSLSTKLHLRRRPQPDGRRTGKGKSVAGLLHAGCATLILNHHMKCGNSLIGGNVREVQDALSRDLFGHQFAGLLSATQLMRKVGELSDVTAQEVAKIAQGVQRSI